jgi:hypothetical protein
MGSDHRNWPVRARDQERDRHIQANGKESFVDEGKLELETRNREILVLLGDQQKGMGCDKTWCGHVTVRMNRRGQDVTGLKEGFVIWVWLWHQQ